MDWIQGQKFWEIADMIFTPKEIVKDDYYNLSNTFNLHKLNNNSIIYTHTIYVKELFSFLNLFSRGNLIVITHNSDVNIGEEYIPLIPKCVKKWFTTNVNANDIHIESIPIGLENDRWFPKLHKKDRMLWQLGQKREYKNMVYMNHNIQTNPAKRALPYALFEDESWVTSERRQNGHGFNGYLNNVYNHKFVICPEGNGIGTHRFWETLYMGSIPIIKANINMNFYHNWLPIFAPKNWDAIDEPWLHSKWHEIEENKGNNKYNMDMLTFGYWKNKILKEKE